ncbi:MAG: hypothetical protein ACKV0T_11195 [Planctomycetales bacterium]
MSPSRAAADERPLAFLLPQGGQGEPAPATETPRLKSAASEIKRARELLAKQSSISAKIVETVTIYDRSYKAEGRYLQNSLKSDDWYMRLELALKVGDSEGSLLEVCDGDVLWTSTQIGAARKGSKKDKDKKEHTVTRRNVKDILNAARKLGEQTETMLITDLGLGGMPGLLASIERDMRFTGVKEEVFRDRPVLLIQGTWSDAFALRLQGQQRGGSGLLPPFVPDSTRIYLDRETGFPHRILYLKKIPGRDVQKPMLTLDFLDVVINQPIDPTEFVYEPPSNPAPLELTNTYLQQLAPPDSKSGPGTKGPR